MVVQGIVLFTFDKYSKSLDSNVPLDAHGNPVTGDVDDVDSTEGEMRPVVDEERVGLTSEAGSQGEFEEVSQTKKKENNDPHCFFNVWKTGMRADIFCMCRRCRGVESRKCYFQLMMVMRMPMNYAVSGRLNSGGRLIATRNDRGVMPD